MSVATVWESLDNVTTKVSMSSGAGDQSVALLPFSSLIFRILHFLPTSLFDNMKSIFPFKDVDGYFNFNEYFAGVLLIV